MKDIKADYANEKLMDALTAKLDNNRGIAERFVYALHLYVNDDVLTRAKEAEEDGTLHDFFESEIFDWLYYGNADELYFILDALKCIHGIYFMPYPQLADLFIIYYHNN